MFFVGFPPGVPVSRGTGEGVVEARVRNQAEGEWLTFDPDTAFRMIVDTKGRVAIWVKEAHAQRAANAALTAEVQRLRGVVEQDAIRFRILADRARGCVKGEISEGHPLSVKEGDWWADDCLAALTPPAADTEGKDNG